MQHTGYEITASVNQIRGQIVIFILIANSAFLDHNMANIVGPQIQVNIMVIIKWIIKVALQQQHLQEILTENGFK